jgi:hypothetical protein
MTRNGRTYTERDVADFTVVRKGFPRESAKTTLDINRTLGVIAHSPFIALVILIHLIVRNHFIIRHIFIITCFLRDSLQGRISETSNSLPSAKAMTTFCNNSSTAFSFCTLGLHEASDAL